MLVEAYVKEKINDTTFDCIVALNKYTTRIQRFSLLPLNKNYKFTIDDILHRAIYIWKHPYFRIENRYLGKLFFVKDSKIFVILQSFEEIYKSIE